MKRRWIVLGALVVLAGAAGGSAVALKRVNRAAITAPATPAGPGAPGFGARTPMGPFKGWVVGLDTTAPAARPTPELNAPFVDPAYNTTVTRVTDPSQIAEGARPTYVRHEYSRRPAFNADGTRVLMSSSNGALHLYAVDTEKNRLDYVKTLKVGGSIEPNWDPVDPHVFHHFGPAGVGLAIRRYDVRTDTDEVARDLEGRVKAIFPSASSMWTKEEGRPSKDGRLWCMMIERYDEATQAVSFFGLVAYDFKADRIVGHLASSERPDHVSASPLGNYCVPSSDGAMGTRAYSPDFAKFTQLIAKSEHSDLGLDKEGREVFVHTDYTSRLYSGYLVAASLDTGDKTPLLRLYGPNHSATAVHISGTAMKKPGYFVVDFDHCTEAYAASACDPTKQWFANKTVIVELGREPKLYNLAHTHFGEGGYWSETQSVANGDLTKVLFASSWGKKDEAAAASYLVDVPPL